MSDTSNTEQDSVLEYSLSEIGFILVFVLLLLSAFEINDNFEKQKESKTNIIILEEKITKQEEQIVLLREAISSIDGGEEWKDDMELVSKSERLIDKQKIQNLQDKLNDIQTAYENQLAEIETDESDELDKEEKGDGSRAGGFSFCTYATPSPESSRVYGRSIAIGKVVIDDNYLTLVDKNLSLADMEVVDIAGKPYDISLVIDALERWPVGIPLTPEEFRVRGQEFIDIGDIPSDHRVACRFGMDWYKKTFTKKSDFNFLRVFQGIFGAHLELSDNELAKYRTQKSTESLSDNLNFERPQYELIQNSRLSLEGEPAQEIISKAPKKLRESQPNYPDKAYRRGVTGYAKLKYVVDLSGLATDIEIIEESPLGVGFGKESVKALKKWRFEPAEVNGIPIRSDTLEVRFSFAE